MRYTIIDRSVTAHCCFTHSVVDTTRPDTKSDAADSVKRLGKRSANDRDEARCESALWRQHSPRGIAHLDDRFSRFDVLGQVEIVNTELVGRGGEADIEAVWKTGNDRFESANDLRIDRNSQIHLFDGKRHTDRFMDVGTGDRKTGLVKESCNQ